MPRATRLMIAILATHTLTACVEKNAPQPDSTGVTIHHDTAPTDPQHPHPPVQDSRQVMKAKLAHAQAVLEGIAMEDFAQVQKNAKHLVELSRQADWLVHQTMDYNVFSTEFRRIAEDMAAHAKGRNIHAVTLDYMQLTLTCVKCHSYMRRQGLVLTDADTPLASLPDPGALKRHQ